MPLPPPQLPTRPGTAWGSPGWEPRGCWLGHFSILGTAYTALSLKV